MSNQRSAKAYRSFRRPPEHLPSASEMTGSLNHLSSRPHHASKKERFVTLSRIRSEAVPQDMDIIDGGDWLKVTSINETQRAAAWWLGTLKAHYPQDTFHAEKEKVKIKPETGLTLCVNQRDGTLKIKGKKHWDWFVDNFENILANAEPDLDAIAALNAILSRALRMEDGQEATAIMKDLPRAGSIKNGPRFIYKLWKAMLNRWMSFGARVVIASPSIDSRRLADIYLLAIKNKGRGFEIRLCTQAKALGKKFEEHQKEAREIVRHLRKPDGKKQLFSKEIIDWAVESVSIRFLSFHCNFISGAISEDRNEIIVTSANFNGYYFDVDAHDTVSYARMTEHGLSQFYLEPLGLAQPSTGRSGSVISLPIIPETLPAPATTHGHVTINGRLGYQSDDRSDHSIASLQRSRPSSNYSDLSSEDA